MVFIDHKLWPWTWTLDSLTACLLPLSSVQKLNCPWTSKTREFRSKIDRKKIEGTILPKKFLFQSRASLTRVPGALKIIY